MQADTYVVATYNSPDPASLRAVALSRNGARAVATAVRNGALPGNVILRGPFTADMALQVAEVVRDRAEMALARFGE